MLPSNGNDVSGTSGDASAASASMHAGEHEGEMADLKQNIDQVNIAYSKCHCRDRVNVTYSKCHC